MSSMFFSRKMEPAVAGFSDERCRRADRLPLDQEVLFRMSSAAAIASLQTAPATDRCRMLSILLPVRNEGINLRIMLKILRAVVELPHEVLVVYDSADDDSIPVVDEVRKIYPELRGVHNQLGNGVVNAIRSGVAASEGDVI